MYLKEIELLGFKSFPVKTKIGFEPGISCVVGPNGSGKSNIADALRWVLGEQSSKALRGGKLEDVIFSGSKNRRRLGMAEVTLTLDNADGYLNQPFSEVSVTRRAFRAGASEYQINSSNCRLRDIQDLFVDTGVGIDGISVVTQGRISEMINARPEDRRSLVEEAAGIVKYRNRKREAVRKLDETERHLERVGDIIGELENRLGPLKRQAEVAEKYLRLKDEADKSEIAISVKVLSEAQERIDQYQKQINTNQEELLRLESLRSALYTEQEQLKLAIAGMDEEVAALQHSYYQLQTDREKAESRLQLAEAQQTTSAANLQRLQAELQALLSGAELRRAQAADMSKALAEAETAAKELEERILSGEGGEKSRREAVEMLSTKLEQAKAEAFSIAAELAELRNRSHYQQQLQEKNLQAGFRVELAWQDAQKQIDAYNVQAAENSARRAALREALDAATALAAANSAAMMELNKQLAELSAAATEARYDCHSLRVKAGMMEDLLSSYDGFFPGVRGILAARGKDKAAAGIIDVAANLLDVPEKYQRAVESFLGASLQNVVAETEADAIAAVRYLKQRDLGRATFLPLDTLRVREAADFSAVLGKPGVCGRASELVKCDKKLDPVREFLLNSLLVVEDLDTAAAMAAKLKYRHHVVTLDGDMVNQGGSISGGSKPKKTNELLSRRSQLAEAKAKLEAAEAKAKELEAQLDALRADIDAKAAEGDRIEAENRARQSELHQLEAAAHEAQTALAAIVRQARATEAERDQIADERVQIEEALIDISKSTEVWATRDEQVREEMATLSAQLEESRAGLDESREDMTRQRVELAALKQKNSGDRAAIKKLADEIEAG
ncbi:MAG: chromosome segregation protein SMC, partial [Firmicutes bacterium]|nr:chromosome segregation protein SMC [Bacillota bacterium]